MLDSALEGAHAGECECDGSGGVSGGVAGAEVEGRVGYVWGVCQGAGKGLLGVRCWAHAGADVRVDGVGVAPLVGRALGRGG